MTRPHLEFIQSQVLPWEPAPANGWHDGAEMKVLSADTRTGACSMVVRYPAGWSRAGAAALTVDEEFFVLSGRLQIGPVAYGPYAYAHLPHGFVRGGAACAEETVVLTFLSGHASTSATRVCTHDPRRLVEKIDTLAAEFSTDFARLGVRATADTSIKPSIAAFLLLRQDPETREQTWLLSARGMRHGIKQELHPVTEEVYCLDGDLVGPYGNMRAGAYFWRPPGIGHGPFGSKGGSLLFTRTQGGALSTTYQDAPDAFDWTRPYSPVLPPALARYRTAVLPEPLPY